MMPVFFCFFTLVPVPRGIDVTRLGSAFLVGHRLIQVVAHLEDDTMKRRFVNESPCMFT